MALFRQQHINIIRDALPVCVKRQGLEIKEFPAAPRKPEGWMVHFDCTRCWKPRDSVKTRYKETIHETAAALAAAIERKEKVLPESRRNPHRSGVPRPSDPVAQAQKLVLPVVSEQLILDGCW